VIGIAIKLIPYILEEDPDRIVLNTFDSYNLILVDLKAYQMDLDELGSALKNKASYVIEHNFEVMVEDYGVFDVQEANNCTLLIDQFVLISCEEGQFSQGPIHRFIYAQQYRPVSRYSKD
jgi:hypothetical protein